MGLFVVKVFGLVCLWLGVLVDCVFWLVIWLLCGYVSRLFAYCLRAALRCIIMLLVCLVMVVLVCCFGLF